MDCGWHHQDELPSCSVRRVKVLKYMIVIDRIKINTLEYIKLDSFHYVYPHTDPTATERSMIVDAKSSLVTDTNRGLNSELSVNINSK